MKDHTTLKAVKTDIFHIFQIGLGTLTNLCPGHSMNIIQVKGAVPNTKYFKYHGMVADSQSPILKRNKVLLSVSDQENDSYIGEQNKLKMVFLPLAEATKCSTLSPETWEVKKADNTQTATDLNNF